MRGFILAHWYIPALYLAIMSLAAFIAFGVDKRRSKHRMWRTPERTLLLLAALGGSPGALFGMRVFHHKTRHRKFTVGVPFILAVQALAVWFFIFRS